MAIIRRTLPGGDAYGYDTGNKNLYYFNAQGDVVNTAPYGSGAPYDYAYSLVKPVLGTVMRASSHPAIDLIEYAPRKNSFHRVGQLADVIAPPSESDAILGQIEF